MDVTQFSPVIKSVLRSLKVRRDQAEDLTQECYVKLLEEVESIESAQSPKDMVARICRNHLLNIFRVKTPRTDSLSDYKTYHRAAKVRNQEPEIPNLTTEELRDAIEELPNQEKITLTCLYLQGMTLQGAGFELGLTRKQIEWRRDKGVARLKERFNGR